MCIVLHPIVTVPNAYNSATTIIFPDATAAADARAASRSHVMAAHDEYSMISPPSSFSNCPEQPSKLPPYPPPLRTGQVLQPLSVFPGARDPAAVHRSGP